MYLTVLKIIIFLQPVHEMIPSSIHGLQKKDISPLPIQYIPPYNLYDTNYPFKFKRVYLKPTHDY